MSKEIRNKDRKVQVNEDWCKGCGICIAFCPAKILVMNERMKASLKEGADELCKECGICELYCPDFAILVIKSKEKKEEDGKR